MEKKLEQKDSEFFLAVSTEYKGIYRASVHESLMLVSYAMHTT